VDGEKEVIQNEKRYIVKAELENEDGSISAKEFRFKKPQSTHFDRMIKEMSSKPTAAMRNYLFSLVDDRDRETLEQTLVEHPGAVVGLTDKLNDKIGVNAMVTIKKL
jgi:hypothetical protein